MARLSTRNAFATCRNQFSDSEVRERVLPLRASNKIEELLPTASKAEMVGLGGRGRDEATLEALRPALLRQQIVSADVRRLCSIIWTG